MQVWQILEAALVAEIAASDHDGTGRLDDAGEVVDGGSGLDFGDEQGPSRVRLGTDATHVVSGTDEADGDHVDAGIDKGIERNEVFGSRCRDLETVAGDVDTWTPSER